MLVWCVHAGVDALDMPARTGDLVDHAVMNADQLFPGEQATAHGCLVGDDDDAGVHALKQDERFQCPRKELEFLPGLDVIRPPAVDDAVPVQKDREDAVAATQSALPWLTR